MSPFRNFRSLLAFAACLTPALVLASPLADPGVREAGLSRRGNTRQLKCGNAPNIVAGNLVTPADISIPSADDGPPTVPDDTTGYFPYLWCLAGTTTYVFMDPIGSYGQNKGTNQSIFWTGLDGGHSQAQNAMQYNIDRDIALPTGDNRIDQRAGETQKTFIVHVGNIASTSDIWEIEIFVRNANHQHLTWGVFSSALTIMKDFVFNYPLYADAMYFQINEAEWGTVGNGYVGVRFWHSEVCYLAGSPTQNPATLCAMPQDYPDS